MLDFGCWMHVFTSELLNELEKIVQKLLIVVHRIIQN
jgi:hypothetical protein